VLIIYGHKTDATQNILQSCSDNQWCCRAPGEASCCDKAFVTNVGQLILPTATISVSGSQTKIYTPAPTVSTSHCSAPECPAFTKDRSALVGGVVGAVLGAALLTSLGVLVWREWIRPNGASTIGALKSNPQFFEMKHEATVQTHHEIGPPEPSELPSGP
jgi:hypothetical protein